MIKKVSGLLRRKQEKTVEESAQARMLPQAATKLYAMAPSPEKTQDDAPNKLPSLTDLKTGKSAGTSAPVRSNQVSENVTEDELKEFEAAIATIDGAADVSNVATETKDNTSLQANQPLEGGFFHEFEDALKNENIREIAEEVVKEDILHRMKQFHEFKKDGRKFHISSSHLKKALNEKITELKRLERDWFDKKNETAALTKLIADREKDIDKRVGELKELMSQFKVSAILERQAPKDKVLLCKDGRRIASLLELKQALINSSEGLWTNYFTKEGNTLSHWIRDAFGDEQLATQISAASNRAELLEIIYSL